MCLEGFTVLFSTDKDSTVEPDRRTSVVVEDSGGSPISFIALRLGLAHFDGGSLCIFFLSLSSSTVRHRRCTGGDFKSGKVVTFRGDLILYSLLGEKGNCLEHFTAEALTNEVGDRDPVHLTVLGGEVRRETPRPLTSSTRTGRPVRDFVGRHQ